METSSNCPESISDREAAISHAAATWFALFLEPGASQSDRSAFRLWIEADERHAKAYAAIERLWLGAGMAPGLADARSISRRKLLKNGTAGILLFGGAAAGAWYATRPAADYSTGVGETRTVSLPDGSTVELSTSTAISIHFDAGRRRIVLQSGEAFFKVAADASRPFVVEAARLTSTALGTAFSVSMTSSSVAVSVAEHAVEVSTSLYRQRVEAGYTVSYEEGMLSQPETTDLDVLLAWRRGKLVFISTPLRDVVASLDRWRRGKMIVVGEALGKRPVTIIVDVRRTERIGQILEEGLPVVVTNYSPWFSVIRTR